MNSVEQLCHFCIERGCAIRADEPMCNHVTMRVGGPVDLFYEPSSVEELTTVVAQARRLDVPLTVVGKGSNLLVADRGIRGMVIHFGNRFTGVSLEGDSSLKALAGTPLTTLCHEAHRHGLSGLEFAFGIPASVGGAVYMNAGAYGGEMKDVLKSVWVLSSDGDLLELAAKDLCLSYRHSVFMESGGIVLAASFSLIPGDREAIGARMQELMDRRSDKQPLDYPSCGSTFKRPQGAYAAALIEQCGLKGRRVGGAMVSEKHAGFVINCQNATCADVLGLVKVIQDEVCQKTGYQLECEVRRLGEFESQTTDC